MFYNIFIIRRKTFSHEELRINVKNVCTGNNYLHNERNGKKMEGARRELDVDIERHNT